ncbi:MAG: methyl-accepting chemotaxis protein, partial [Cyanobacteria bacterium P01_F01_bin.86]
MLANVFGGFQKFKIQHQLLLLVLLSATIPASVVGAMGIFSATNALSEIATATLQEEVDDKVEEFDDFLSGVSSDVLFLSKAPSVQGLGQAQTSGDSSAEANWIAQMQVLFTDLMEEKPYYTRIRYLDAAGNELVGVNFDGSSIAVLPDSQLKSIADRAYVVETFKMAPGNVFVSPVELKRGQDEQIEEPYKPVIRYSTPVVDASGQVRGAIVVNIFADQLIDEFTQIRETDAIHQNEDLLLVNQDGYYLHHPDSSKAWGFELGKEEEVLTNDFTPEVAEQILGEESGVIDVGSELLAHHKFIPDPEHPSALIAIAEVPKGVVFAPVNRFKVFSGIAILGSLGIGLPIAIAWGRQLVALMEKLTASISTSSQEMATTIAEQERVASQQATSVNETTTTMDELEASSRHAAEQANAAVEAARQAFKVSEVGAQAIGESLEEMFVLDQKVQTIAEQIVALSEQASQIGNISQMVIDFANQTNMLALNSSVEAVRAGEHGKGFNVVATEIRKLADQSQQSADKINVLVADIQKSVNATVMAAEEGTKTVKTNVRVAQRTEKAFEEIKDAVNQVVVNNQQV